MIIVNTLIESLVILSDIKIIDKLTYKKFKWFGLYISSTLFYIFIIRSGWMSKTFVNDILVAHTLRCERLDEEICDSRHSCMITKGYLITV